MKKKIKKVIKKVTLCCMKIKFVNVLLLKNNTLSIELIKIFNDNSTKNEKHTLSKVVVDKLKNASCQKEFASIVNNEFVRNASLDAHAKKMQLTKNTQYCTSRNYIALALNKTAFAEVAFKQRHEAKKTLKKVAKVKAKKTVKKTKVKKTVKIVKK